MYSRLMPWLAGYLCVTLLGCGEQEDSLGNVEPDDGASSEQQTPDAELARKDEPASSTGPITLPLEVLGPSGTRVAASFNLRAPVDDITHLLVTCHSCGYNDHALDSDPTRIKAAVRVNDGPQIALKHYTGADRGTVVGNPDLALVKPDDAAYGGVGGGYRTNTMLVPIRGLQAGVNTLTFEHVSASFASLGFRILSFNLLRGPSPDTAVLPRTRFRQENPASWTLASTVGSTDSAVIERAVTSGRNLWNKTNHLYDPYLDAIDGAMGSGNSPLNGRISASCADCHAQDGRDLKYFNFSDRSIIARSVFHKLTRKQGQNIAAYIRSLRIPVQANARPWNPPYQPGKGMDSRGVYGWAAGAGLQAVLDSDADMRAYLFPNGETNAQVRAVTNRFGKLNIRELPIALQLPDWNQWLPTVHPKDAFDSSRAPINQDEKGVAVGAPFYQVLYNAARANPTPARLSDLTLRVGLWFGRGATCFTQQPTSGPGIRGANGVVAQALRLGSSMSPNVSDARCAELRDNPALVRPLELAKHGLLAWQSVKLWEIHHSNNLETRGASQGRNVCIGNTCVNASEARGWVTPGSNVFTRAPHLVAHTSRHFLTQAYKVGIYESNAWYHLQMVLNPGYRLTMPVYFPYTQTHIEALERATAASQSFRFWASLIKQRQLQTTGRYGEDGLNLRTAEPYIYYSDDTGQTSVRAGVGPTLWRQLAQAMLVDLVQDARRASPQDWQNATGLSSVQPPTSQDFSPCERCFEPGPNPNPFVVRMAGRNTARVIPRFRLVGVSETVLGQLLDWSETMWPLGPWDELRNP